MLDYKLLERKQVIHKGTDQYIDLLSKTFDESVYSNAIPLIVNKYYVDNAIAQVGGGSVSVIDANGVTADNLAILQDFYANYLDDKEASLFVKDIENNKSCELYFAATDGSTYIDFEECLYKGKEDPGLIEDPKKETIQKIDKYNKQKRKNEDRSPNEQTIGESNFVIDKSLGLVFY